MEVRFYKLVGGVITRVQRLDPDYQGRDPRLPVKGERVILREESGVDNPIVYIVEERTFDPGTETVYILVSQDLSNAASKAYMKELRRA